MPRPARPLPSIRTASTPLRASCAATIVPEKPPPMTATGRRRSDFIVRPFVRILRARLALHHDVMKAQNGAAGGLSEPYRYNGVNDAGCARADQLGPDLHGPGTMARPAHSQRARMVGEDVPGPWFSLFYSHCPTRCEPNWWPRQDSNLRPAV